MIAFERIGFMQGRLSPMVSGRIQAFPWAAWKDEFAKAERLGFHLMEWTLDQDRLDQNPLLTADGQREIIRLMRRHSVTIPSLTGDCFMQAPFWKATGDAGARQRDFRRVAAASAAIGISLIVVPLVDRGRLESRVEEDALVTFLELEQRRLQEFGLRVLFECDYDPPALARFIGRFDPAHFGVNYDIGNSASLGFDPSVEVAEYGARIGNVHVKDRLRGGTTVPLGTGAARLREAIAALEDAGFQGNYVLQTARAADGDDAGVLSQYRGMTAGWLDATCGRVPGDNDAA